MLDVIERKWRSFASEQYTARIVKFSAMLTTVFAASVVEPGSVAFQVAATTRPAPPPPHRRPTLHRPAAAPGRDPRSPCSVPLGRRARWRCSPRGASTCRCRWPR